MKKLFAALLLVGFTITATAQTSINVAPTTASTKTKIVMTATGTNEAIAAKSKTDQAAASTMAATAQVNAIKAANIRQDSLVLAFESYRKSNALELGRLGEWVYTSLKNDTIAFKRLDAIPNRDSIYTGKGLRIDSLRKGAKQLTPQFYFDTKSNSIKQNY